MLPGVRVPDAWAIEGFREDGYHVRVDGQRVYLVFGSEEVVEETPLRCGRMPRPASELQAALRAAVYRHKVRTRQLAALTLQMLREL